MATVSRVEDGKQEPSAESYLRLLRAAGFFDDGERIVPLSRPSAVWTARWLLGDLDDEPDQASEWVSAWQRLGLVTDDLDVPDVEELAHRAGCSAALVTRPRIVTALSSWLVPQIAERLDEAGVDYAVTGDEALERLGSMIIPTWPVLYVHDLRAALTATGFTPRLAGERGGHQVSFLPFDGTSETGRVRTDDGIWWVSALQAVLDGYSGYGRMTEQAQYLVELWESEKQ